MYRHFCDSYGELTWQLHLHVHVFSLALMTGQKQNTSAIQTTAVQFGEQFKTQEI